MTAKPTSSGRMNMTQKNDNPKINKNKTKIFCKKNDDLNEDLNEKRIKINFPLPGWQRLT